MASGEMIVQTQRSAVAVAALRLAGVYLELAKARLIALVLVTVVVGYVLAADAAIAWGGLAWLLLGTALVAGGANGLNQCAEAPADRRMARTGGRPLVLGRIGLRHARTASTAWVTVGVFVLWAMVNLLTAGLAAAAALIYISVYTPLKQWTSACTPVGAVVGAVPPMMGAAAASGHLAAGAWTLAAILFTWQIPHTLALAWVYREDYARGGQRLLIGQDMTGRWTFRTILLFCLALLPVSLLPYAAGLSGWGYAVGAVLLAIPLLALAVQLYRTADEVWARWLFRATVIYLPVLLGLLLMDR
jgi:protoheme IX farnesyltransferase